MSFEQVRGVAVTIEVQGTVIPGEQKARALGCPTGNISIHNFSEPEGVYFGYSRLMEDHEQKTYPSLCFVRNQVLEVHLMHERIDLYGKKMEVTLLRYLRPPVPFESERQMRELIRGDFRECEALSQEVTPFVTPKGV